ncbi:hypothetical protein [Nocardioides hwasunensis]|uniref:Uncharacterized protein n=1 Tax=Nocardioides hwasunensis TaxID=397258 RepID=A0ABR8MBW0_9ACTN|nr:hypothetical protein [Nocardioides hwasunensis]MBD3913338.1 hypothetical protein [Nocardioides hwasunensis]
MSDTQTTQAGGFTAHGDGRYRGDDGHGGELAGMALYVVRALAQVDQLLGLGEMQALHAGGGRRELSATVGHEGDFGLEVTCTLSSTGVEPAETTTQAVAATLGDELDHVMDQVSGIEMVAGCFVVSASGDLVADKVPGIDRDGLAGTGRRMKVAYDAFDRFLGTTSLVAGYAWVQLVSAPVGNGLAVAIADLGCSAEEIVSAIHVGGGVLSGVDLATFRTGVLAD